MTSTSFLSFKELLAIGLRGVGNDCKISRRASIYGANLISIGSNVRLDDFCVLTPSFTGEIFIGDNVHIAPFCLLSGRGIISIGDHVNISSKVSIYSSSDDFSGIALPGPQSLLDSYHPFQTASIDIASFSIVGAGSVLLPGAELEKGASVGALSLVKEKVPAFTVYAGIPARYIRARKKDFLNSIDD